MIAEIFENLFEPVSNDELDERHAELKKTLISTAKVAIETADTEREFARYSLFTAISDAQDVGMIDRDDYYALCTQYDTDEESRRYVKIAHRILELFDDKSKG